MDLIAVNEKSEETTDGWFSRERAIALMFVVVTGVVFYLCYRIVVPFLPALAWALALAIMARPIHRRIALWIPYANVAAALSVVVVALLVVAPVVFVTHRLVSEGAIVTQNLQEQLTTGKWRTTLEGIPLLSRTVPWVEKQFGLGNKADPEAGESDPAATVESGEPAATSPVAATAERAVTLVAENASTLVTNSIWFVMQLFITLMTLFFFFRDRRGAVGKLRSLLPLNDDEASEMFKRIDDTIHATIYGSVAVAIVQGTLGGLMFWWLGIPAPLVWGAIMAMLAVIPVLGTFVIWAPTAIGLALQGEWKSALILVAWGTTAIGLVDNLLYPFLVGSRLRFHTLLVFFAIVGGLALFGASGIILGPLTLSLADALIDFWRRRTSGGGTIEGAVETTG